MGNEIDADQDGVDLLEALMLAVDAVISTVDTRKGSVGDIVTPDELASVILQMEHAIAAFRGED